MTDKLDIRQLDTEALLQDFTVPASNAPSPLDMWLESAGIYPGTTRVGARELYDAFRAWCQANAGIIDKIPVIHVWGRDMAMRFKRGKGKRGNFYYISRERQVDIHVE